MDSKATINLPLSEYMEWQKLIGERDKRIAELEAAVRTEQERDPEQRVIAMVKALKAVVPVVQFAAGNLPPETSPGWPYEALHTFANCLIEIPGGDQNLIELGRDLAILAREIEPFEKARARGERAEPRVGGPG